MRDGKIIQLSNSDTIFMMYQGDMVAMMIPTTPITAHVCSIDTLEAFAEQFKNKNKFKIYER